MNKGSNTRFVTVPAMWLIMPGIMTPSARTMDAVETENSISGDPIARIRR